MVPATFRVVLDANVLFPFTLRDTLLRAAAAGYFQLYWSAEILDEARRNLVGHGVINEAQAARLLAAMQNAFPEATVTDYESLIDAMSNHEKNRHVAAAAVKAGAQVVVTFNTKDFHDLPEGIEPHSPSMFLTDLLDLDPAGVIDPLRKQAAALKRPPKTFDQLLDGLAKTVPGFVEQVRTRLNDDESGGGSGGGSGTRRDSVRRTFSDYERGGQPASPVTTPTGVGEQASELPISTSRARRVWPPRPSRFWQGSSGVASFPVFDAGHSLGADREVRVYT